MRLALGLLSGLLVCNWAIAQNTLDTVKLAEVTVYGISAKNYTSGSKTHVIDSASIQLYGTASLAEVLGAVSPVFIRSYGNGMLASPSFRGTSANHTSILWNGLNLNQPTLGQSDLSLLPSFALDQAEIHFGGGSPLFGSDAIGGTIALSDHPLQNFKGVKAGAISEVGSFQYQFHGLKVYAGNQRVQSKTIVYRSSSKNNFEFHNITKPGFPLEKQNNAAIQYEGLIQNLNVNINPHWSASLKTWYYQSDREIQPNMPSNQNAGMFSQQQDASLRILADMVHHPNKSHITEIKAAYLYDKLIYGLSGAIEKYYSHQYQIMADHERQWLPSFKSRVGLKTNFIEVDSDGFTFIPSELRSDFYLSNTFQPNHRFRASFNFRQVLMDRSWAAPSPSLGFEWTFLDLKKSSLALNAQLSRSYRLPTFNERYWPTGNPNILPEQGYIVEMGVKYLWKQESISFNTEIRAYEMLIDDWVIWQSGNGGVTPVNIQQVLARGLEWTGQLSGRRGALKYTFQSNYAYSKSTTEKSRLSNDFVGKQLIYVPLNKVGAGANFRYRFLTTSINYNFTGHRYYSLSNDDFLPSYQLIDLYVGSSFNLRIFNLEAEAGLKVYNLLDAQYQVLRFYAATGRNFRLSLSINI